MSSMIKQKLLTNWHTMRWVALSIGVFLAVMAILHEDTLTGFFSAFFIFQAVTNTGCMVSQSCGVPQKAPVENLNDSSEPEFTEIK